MQGVTETAALIDRPHPVAGLDFFPHPLQEAGGREAHGGLGMLMVALERGGDLFQIHVQAEFQNGPHWGIALWRILCCVVHVMNGLMVCFRSPERVPVLHALVNPSWHLTAVGAVSSAIAVHVAGRRWLSFFR